MQTLSIRLMLIAVSVAAAAAGAHAAGPISFLPPVSYMQTAASGLTAADLDADGNLDLLVGDIGNGGRLSVLYGRGDGTFEPPVQMHLDNGYQLALGSNNQMVAADVNRDGVPDLIVADSPAGKVLVFINEGHRTFAAPVGYPTAVGPLAITTADFNGDGWLDMAVSNHASGNLSVLLNRGDGTFQPAVSYPVGGNCGGVSSADLNGDGKIDLAVSTIVGNTVVVFLGDGTGKFTPAGSYSVGAAPGHVIIDDFDGDGKPDIATDDWFGNTVSLLRGDGTGKFSPAVQYPTGGYTGVMGSADRDGDGSPDLVCALGGSTYAGALLNDGTGMFLPSMLLPAGGQDTRTLAVGDFNNDGRPDIAVGNQSSFTVSILINNTPRPTPAIRSVAVSPSSVIGGCDTMSGVVTLTDPAPAGGTVVTLTSTDPAVLVPSSVKVSEGATRVSFTPTLSPVTTTATGTITARYQGSGKRTSFAVQPGGMAGLKLTPIAVIGGRLVDGAVTFPCPAGSGGLTIMLSSSQPTLAVVPGTVTAPTGATSATFAVATKSVAAITSVTITAMFAGTSRTASLELRPVPPPPPPPPPVNLLVNGSYEDPDTSSSTIGWLTYGPAGIPGKAAAGTSIPGWRITDGTVKVVSWYWKAAVGNQTLDLVGDNPGTIEQGFATDVGRDYILSGVIAHNPANFYFAEGRGNVFVDRMFLTQLLHQDPTVTVSEMHWTPFSVRFRATKSMTTLTISDATGSPFPGGLVLDDLAVSPAGN
jgi:hypothetical protein